MLTLKGQCLFHFLKAFVFLGGGWGEGGRRIEQKGKRTHGPEQQCGDCGEKGRHIGDRGIRD